ncbi:DUF4865 family protein [Labrys wisconsinensis]|uniref:DUF4865 domain-containing protein n=1 Tax=Labrys wisconsinensis TaxID=425677 RepID=A0ABU0JJE2_9HYPH|nr:DUF4865 family protein [Labrys wisconsinensis]MDQ0473730.1 hypothetical protein [Labrys wisconsinensis]
MIAMQYSFTLPADYDMAIVERRIVEKGPMLDGFPGLAFKAYLSARAGDAGSRENLYAPFYLWEKDEGLSDFLTGEGFVGLTRSFGWPTVRTWIAWQASLSGHLAEAAFATREILATEPHAPLGAIRRSESAAAAADVESGGALAAVAGFEPTTWTRVRFRLWRDKPEGGRDVQVYGVGHMSLGA